MPRYVAKEDVEKGLVDPKRPLEEQPEYKQKIDEQEHKKQKQPEQKNIQHRPKKQRAPRKEKPKFNWNKNQVTLQTKIPEKPKKLLEKPNSDKYREGLQKLKAERQALKQQRYAILDEQRVVLRNITENKKQGREAITQYSGAMKDKFLLENQLRKEIRALDDHKKKINFQIESLNSRINSLSKPTDSQGYSIQFLQYEIDSKEQHLMTANINKREETKLTNEINDLKRALNKARPQIEIQSQLNKLQDQIDILYREVKPIKHELHIKITEANSIRAELDTLKQQRKTQQGQAKVQRTAEDIRADYDLKLKALEDKKNKLEDSIDDYVDQFVRKNDQYEDQQALLDYIAWVEDQVSRIKKRKEDQDKRQKEKEEWEKKKQKEKQQYQKRQEERKKYDEQRKAKEQERKKRLQEERERFINRNPNHQLIDLCQSLIAYCQHLKPNSTYKYEDPRVKQGGQLNFGKEWQKQIKSGAQVIVSKKAKVEEDQKKPVKAKKKQQKQQDENFAHGIEIVNQFQTLKLLPPVNAAEIDASIKLIKEKIAFYNNPTEEERAAFKEKAIKEFEERNAPRERRQYKEHKEHKEFKEKRQQGGQAIKDKKAAPRKQKKELKDQDFPDLK